MHRAYEGWVKKALSVGFTGAAVLDASTLSPLDAVRDMCAVNQCGKFGSCWTCPPACGSIEENRETLQTFTKGIIVQTTMRLEDDFDYDTMELCGKRHRELFVFLYECLRGEGFANVLALGAGGCDHCERCAYPGARCRHPEKALSSMEAYGLLVSDVCKQNGLPYYYGPRTMTYTGCYLFD